VVSYVLTLGLAVLSWHLIEAPALRLKPRRQAPTAPVAPA
jgi:peptidoglycan/LPS O-acetylase OafA/YrhL